MMNARDRYISEVEMQNIEDMNHQASQAQVKALIQQCRYLQAQLEEIKHD